MRQQPAITLDDVNRAMTARRWNLTFPEPVETHFTAEMDERRARAMRRILPRTLLIYNAFLVGDYLLTPDAMAVSLIVHFAMVTPWIIAAIVMLPRMTSRFWRDLLVASLPLSIIVGVLAVFSASRSPLAEHYQYFVIVALLYGNAVLRPSITLALIISAVTVVAHGVALALHPVIPPVVAVSASACLVVASYVSLSTNAAMERDLRRLYLRRLSESLVASDLEQAAADLHRITLVDPLTGLANRRGIDARAAAFTGGADGGPFAVLMIDVDRFKPFNDHYGHPEGDKCLAAVARAIRDSVRGGVDVAGRYGGEEFLVLLPGATLAEAVPAAERIRRAVEALALPHAAAETGMVTVSIGLAAADGLSADMFSPLVAAADAALYVAKQAGRNRVHAAGDVPSTDTAGRRSRPASDAA
ncbi:GGDEF domain-containing protein [Phreatobacter oligotrophus]|uniref:diguanylate cyclase n=1 Tax=Phreatobacter oligotrophus TaxID=1122261 RepID=A0A2T4ZIA2_9HYPH|nr:diguanylate cyclase [Phreatobacter oligotrophus]PTM61713.1 diguanylate cyclase (GGDEF)-like protein [Phreatobacter oligotrophus]